MSTMIRVARIIAVGVFGAACSTAVFAQSTYKCSGPSGVYYADRPCAADEKTTSMTPVLPQPVPRPVSVDSRTGYLAHMSGECRRIRESLDNMQASHPRIRTEWELKRRQLSDTLERYRALCLEEERLARQRVAEADRAEREQQRSRLLAQQVERRREITEKDQCDEMRGIRQAKRQRLDLMSPGERADFERFESAFKSRCEGIVPR